MQIRSTSQARGLLKAVVLSTSLGVAALAAAVPARAFDGGYGSGCCCDDGRYASVGFGAAGTSGGFGLGGLGGGLGAVGGGLGGLGGGVLGGGYGGRVGYGGGIGYGGDLGYGGRVGYGGGYGDPLGGRGVPAGYGVRREAGYIHGSASLPRRSPSGERHGLGYLPDRRAPMRRYD